MSKNIYSKGQNLLTEIFCNVMNLFSVSFKSFITETFNTAKYRSFFFFLNSLNIIAVIEEAPPHHLRDLSPEY